MRDDEVPLLEILFATVIVGLCLGVACILLLRHLCGVC